MPLQRRLPKRGFRPVNRRVYAIVNLTRLAGFPPGSKVGPEEMRAAGIVRRRLPVKVLAKGELGHPLTVISHAFSARARARIEAAGGHVEVLRV